MRRHHIVIIAFTVIVGLGGLAYPQAGGPFDQTWSTIDGGGQESAGGVFEIYGTVGQPDAATFSGGAFTIDSGFWNFETAQVPVELSAFTLE